MKQRIITAIIALAFFTPFVLIGGWPFTLVIYAIATIGLYEILRMRDIKILSIPGVLTWIALAVILIPSSFEHRVYDMVGYSKIELVFAVALLLLIHTVIVKNRFTFDHVAFSVFRGFIYRDWILLFYRNAIFWH